MPARTTLVLTASIVLGASTEGSARGGHAVAAPSAAPMVYPTAPVAGATPPGSYAFKDEPVMSINNSYLGYSNFVDPDHPTPRYVFSHGATQPQVHAPIRQRPPRRWFGWRRRGR
jgi:hypothetical protein